MPVDDQLKDFYDVWGSDKTYNHMAVPWSWAFDTPFSWTKQIASHFGGIRQGMCDRRGRSVIKDEGGIRNQFHHVIDIVPTILEAAAVAQPKMVDGITQSPIEGVSMAYTFDKANASAPSTHKTQYFEMMGDHAIYHDGWIASTKVIRPPWDIVGADEPGSGQHCHLGTLRPDQGLDAVGERRRQASRRSSRRCRSSSGRRRRSTRCCRSTPSVATRLVDAAAEHHRRSQRVHLDTAAHRHAERRCALRS